MNKEFSTKWKASKRPAKQRKFRSKAPLHLRKKFVSVNLSKELRKKYEKRNVPVKKGDTVKILRGKFKGKKGKVTQVFLKISKLIIENIQVKKQDGSKANVKIQPSNVQIIELNLEDNKRLNKNIKKTEVKEEKMKKENPKKKNEDKVEKKSKIKMEKKE